MSRPSLPISAGIILAQGALSVAIEGDADPAANDRRDDIDDAVLAIARFKAQALSRRYGMDKFGGDFEREVSGLVAAITGAALRTARIPAAVNDNAGDARDDAGNGIGDAGCNIKNGIGDAGRRENDVN